MVQPFLGCTLDHNCPIIQVLKFKHGRYLGKNCKKHAFKQKISPLCNLRTTHQNDNCLQLLSCYKNKYINTLRTDRHNKAVHAPNNTLLANLMTRCFTLINSGKFKTTPRIAQYPQGYSFVLASFHDANVQPYYIQTYYVS
jgi:hypothetical protein